MDRLAPGVIAGCLVPVGYHRMRSTSGRAVGFLLYFHEKGREPMRRCWGWLTRSSAQADTQRAVAALLLVWFGGALGAFLGVFSLVTQEWGGVLQGVALVVLALAVMLQ